MKLDILNSRHFGLKGLPDFLNCAGITEGADFDCADPLQAGVNQRLMLGNLEDISVVTFSVVGGEENVVTAIAMKSGKAMFAFEGFRVSLNPRYLFVPQTVSIGWDHQIDFSIFDVSQSQKLNMQAMAVVPQFAITQYVDDSSRADNFFEVFGLGRGLEVLANEVIPGDSETGAAHVVQLKTPEAGGRESEMPATFFLTDFVTTLALVDALLIPAA